ncbi:hypothetical protein J2X64_000558 [Phycicoccus sp. 3266]|nr:hypothetical protein [Phycicoccus sp. 3266]
MTTRGRPSKLTPERADRIVELIGSGVYGAVAARASGISGSTYRAWMARGRDASRDAEGRALEEADAPYAAFHDAVRTTQAQAEAETAAGVYTAGQGSWKAAAWWLERRYPERWGRKDRLRQEVTGLAGAPLHVDAKAELLALLAVRGLPLAVSETPDRRDS